LLFLRFSEVGFGHKFPFLLYITKYCGINRFWKVPLQINANVSNKYPLKLPCAYLNTQGSSPFKSPLKLIDHGKFIDIIMRYSLKFSSLVQYFAVLAMTIFLHFRSTSNKLYKVDSTGVEMYKCYYDYEHFLEGIWRSSCINIHQMEFYSALLRARVLFRFPLLLLKSHHSSTFSPISGQIRFYETRFWKVLRHINSYVSNKWPLKYQLKLPRVIKYFFVLSNSIFLHFRSVSNKLIKVV
ncbi:hypothetical protein T07_13780, partial [Trichinella nelsoni]